MVTQSICYAKGTSSVLERQIAKAACIGKPDSLMQIIFCCIEKWM